MRHSTLSTFLIPILKKKDLTIKWNLLSIFPNAYKVAQVTPLFKGGDAENLNSYRPMSLLPVLGKLLEKIISVRTIKFLDKFNLLSENQFGFRAKFSTEYAV